jgi:hypothetical protein
VTSRHPAADWDRLACRVGLVGLLVTVLSGPTTLGHRSVPAGATPRRCNGLAVLCDRSLGDVVFATSHNSMSSSVDRFRGPNQGETIAQQLRKGIRGFQIDAYLGATRKNRIYTDLSRSDPVQSDLPPALVRAGLALHRRLGAPLRRNRFDVYLCHTLCELGAVSFEQTLRDMRRFLDRHPDDVLLLVIEDYVPPEQLLSSFDDSDLSDRLLPVAATAALPTLGEMLAEGKQMLATLENGDLPPLLPNAFLRLVEETPFTFLTASALDTQDSCIDNRGPVGAPIFQLNHWLTPAGGRRARAVNYRVLRRRVDECRARRGRAPTLVAVDFAEDSDVIEVTRDMNTSTRASG